MDLLSKIELEVLEEDDGTGTHTKDILNDIVNRYTNDRAAKEPLEDYISVELNEKFYIHNSMDSFEFIDEKNSPMRLLETSSIELQIILALIDFSSVNAQRIADWCHQDAKFMKELHDKVLSENKKELKGFTALFYHILKISCSVHDLNKLLSEENSVTSNILKKLFHNSLQLRNFHEYENVYKGFKFKPNVHLNATIHMVIELSDILSNRIATLNNQLYLEIRDGKFCVSNDEYTIAMYESFEFELGKKYNVTLVLKSQDLELFIDGNSINKLTIITEGFTSIGAIDIGSPICSFKLFEFCVFDTVLPEAVITSLTTLNIINMFNEDLMQYAGTNERKTNNWNHRIPIGKNLEKFLIYQYTFEEQLASQNKSTTKMVFDNTEKSEYTSGNFHAYKEADVVASFEALNGVCTLMEQIYKSENLSVIEDRVLLLLYTVKHPSIRSQYYKDYDINLLAYTLLEGPLKRLKTLPSIALIKGISELCCWNTNDPTQSYITDHDIFLDLYLNLNFWRFYEELIEEDHCQAESVKNNMIEIVSYQLYQLESLVKESTYKEENSIILESHNLLQTMCNTLCFLEKSKRLRITNKCTTQLVKLFSCLLANAHNPTTFTWYINTIYYNLKVNCHTNFIMMTKAFNEYLNGMTKDYDNTSIGVNIITPKILLIILEELSTHKLDPSDFTFLLFRYFSINSNVWKKTLKNGGWDILLTYITDLDLSYFESLTEIILLFAVNDLDHYNTETFALNTQTTNNQKENVIRYEAIELLCTYMQWRLHDPSMLDTKNIQLLDTTISRALATINDTIKFDNIQSLDNNRTTNLILAIENLALTLTQIATGEKSLNALELAKGLLNNFLITDLELGKHDSYKHYCINRVEAMNSSFLRRMHSDKPNHLLCFFSKELLPNLVDHFFVKYKQNEPARSKAALRLCELILFVHSETSRYHILENDHRFWLELFLKCSDLFSDKVIHNSKMKIAFLKCLKKLLIKIMYAIQFQKLNKKTEENCFFYKYLLAYQLMLFGKEYLGCDRILIMNMIILIGLQINENKADSLALDCLRSVILHQSYDLIHLANNINHEYRMEVMQTLENLLTMDNDEAISMLTESGYFLFSVNQKYRLEDYLNDHTKSLSAIKLEDNNTTIYPRDIYSTDLEALLKNCKSTTVLFANDNANYSPNIIKMQARISQIYESDINEERFLSHSKLLNLLKRRQNILDTQDELELNKTWNLDFLEDCGKQRQRILQTYKVDETGLGNYYNKFSHGVKITDSNAESIRSFDMVPELEQVGTVNSLQTNENRKILKLLKAGDSIQSIWNCSLIKGLNISEGMLIIGSSFVYFVDGFYYLSSERRVLRIEDAPENVRDINIKYLKGMEGNTNSITSYTGIHTFEKNELAFVTKRPYLLRDTALEMLFTDGRSFLLNLKNKLVRNELHDLLSYIACRDTVDIALATTLNDINRNSSNITTQNGIAKDSVRYMFSNAFSGPIELFDKSKITKLWKEGEVSNFHYLMMINMMAGRSCNDLTQYPVFPWVIKEYTTDTLQTTNPINYRDLDKPMGAQTEKRCNEFIERYQLLSELDSDGSLPFHYGTHYSSAMITANYMLRLEPFHSTFMTLQDGNLGHADRLFSSVERTWRSAASESTTDVRELIPEFFYLPEFLKNINDYNLGTRQDGSKVADVILPPWAKGDPKIFTEVNRKALESRYVSEHLHNWIDLIFGAKQRGKEAIESVNVFNSLSYPGTINLDNVNDENERMAITGIIHNFGQTPLQIFRDFHPQKKHIDSYQAKELFLAKLPEIERHIKHVNSDSSATGYCSLEPSANGFGAKNGECWNVSFVGHSVIEKKNMKPMNISIKDGNYIQIEDKILRNLHNTTISYLKILREGMFITGDTNGLLRLWGISNWKEKRVELKATFCGHMNEIKTTNVMYSSSIMISIDQKRQVFQWDLCSGMFIRRLGTDIKNIAISQLEGNIALLKLDNTLYLKNINGDTYWSGKIPNIGDLEVTCLDFFDFTNLEQGFAKHRYWEEKEILIVGTSDCKLRFYEFGLDFSNMSWTVTPVCYVSVHSPVLAVGNYGTRINDARILQIAALDISNVSIWNIDW